MSNCKFPACEANGKTCPAKSGRWVFSSCDQASIPEDEDE